MDITTQQRIDDVRRSIVWLHITYTYDSVSHDYWVAEYPPTGEVVVHATLQPDDTWTVDHIGAGVVVCAGLPTFLSAVEATENMLLAADGLPIN